MNAKSNPLDQIVVSDRVRQNEVLLHSEALNELRQEVVIRPLPPEIDKIVRKFLSRY